MARSSHVGCIVRVLNSSGGTVRDVHCLSPKAVHRDATARGYSTEDWYGRGNAFWQMRGAVHSRAWTLVRGSNLDVITPSVLAEIIFKDAGSEINLGPMLFSEARPLYMGLSSPDARDGDAAYLVEWVSPTVRASNYTINKAYNVMRPNVSVASSYLISKPAKSYYKETLRDPEATDSTPWTWQQVAQDLFDDVRQQTHSESYRTGLVSTVPFPASVPGRPINLRFHGVTAWEALCSVLADLGLALWLDHRIDTFKLVEFGSEAPSPLPSTEFNSQAYRAAFVCGYQSSLNSSLWMPAVNTMFPKSPYRYGAEKDPLHHGSFAANPVSGIDLGDGAAGIPTWAAAPALVSLDNTSVLNDAETDGIESSKSSTANAMRGYMKVRRLRYKGIKTTVPVSSEIGAVGWHDLGPNGVCTDFLGWVPGLMTAPASLVATQPPDGVPPLLSGKDARFALQGGTDAAWANNRPFDDATQHGFPGYPHETAIVSIDELIRNEEDAPKRGTSDWAQQGRGAFYYSGWLLSYAGHELDEAPGLLNWTKRERVWIVAVCKVANNGVNGYQPPLAKDRIYIGRIVGLGRGNNTAGSDGPLGDEHRAIYLVDGDAGDYSGVAHSNALPIDMYGDNEWVGKYKAGANASGARNELALWLHRPGNIARPGIDPAVPNLETGNIADYRLNDRPTAGVGDFGMDIWGQGIPIGSYVAALPRPGNKHYLLPEPHPKAATFWLATPQTVCEDVAPEEVTVWEEDAPSVHWDNYADLDGNMYAALVTGDLERGNIRLLNVGWYWIEYNLAWGGVYGDLGEAESWSIPDGGGTISLNHSQVFSISRATSVLVADDGADKFMVRGSQGIMETLVLWPLSSDACSKGGTCRAGFWVWNYLGAAMRYALRIVRQDIPTDHNAGAVASAADAFHLNGTVAPHASIQITDGAEGACWLRATYCGIWGVNTTGITPGIQQPVAKYEPPAHADFVTKVQTAPPRGF